MLRIPNFQSILLAMKIAVGASLVFAILLNGETHGGCPPGVNCLMTMDVYLIRFDVLTAVASLLGLALLISTFIDLLVRTAPILLVARDVESIAHGYGEFSVDTIGRPTWQEEFDFLYHTTRPSDPGDAF